MRTHIWRPCLLAVALFLSSSALCAADRSGEYSTFPLDRVVCTIRTQNADGSIQAVGTDFRSSDNIYVETVALSLGGVGARSWVLDRHATEVVWVQGGYAVFKKHCASVVVLLPEELRGKFADIFSE